MLYNIPGRTGCNLEPETTARLLDLPNVVSYKAASGTTEEVSRLRALCGDQLAIYCGDDPSRCRCSPWGPWVWSVWPAIWPVP